MAVSEGRPSAFKFPKMEPGQQQFPAQHTTTTAAPSQADHDNKIRLNSAYIHTMEGRLKLAHLAVSIIVFICIMASNYPRAPHSNWISFVSMCAFWTSAVLLFFWCINLVGMLTLVPWLTLELVYVAIWTFFWFVAGCVAVDYAVMGLGDAFAVAAFFSYVAMCIYGFNAFIFYKKWRDSGNQFNLRMGSANTTTTTTTTTSTVIREQKY
ncbi:hypothetical protein Pmani_035655 [Petrolisthes manimaculis]|uniref:MARVEL domain-containing protein n=1 Tax=Petrolisthes manimaculis TaxID=1843537 RepID=A0AAE1NMI2_9EUCA|nr:hypothetical protein Pmani_035655 [Petrolisthes manimaculis]